MDAANDLVFTLKDVIYIVGLISGGLWQWFHYGGRIKDLEKQAVVDKAEHLKDLTAQKEAFIAYKSARKASFKEMEERIDKHMESKMFEPMRMVTSMEEKMEKHEDKMEKKFDKLTEEITQLRKDIMEILKGNQ